MNKIIEYMALGKAIVAPASANIKEILTHGEDALLFVDEDADFAKYLCQLVDDGELRKALGVRARASLLRQDLTWEANARRIEKLSEELLGKTNDSQD